MLCRPIHSRRYGYRFPPVFLRFAHSPKLRHLLLCQSIITESKMLFLTMSRRGLRAFLTLGISISFFFVSQHLRGAIPGLDEHLASVRTVNHKSLGAPAQYLPNQLAKRVAIPFGDATVYSFFSPPDLDLNADLHGPNIVKRASWSLEVNVAICKGQKLLDRMADASHNAPGRQINMASIKLNGWTVTDEDLQFLPAPVIGAMQAYGVETADTKQRNADLDHDFPKNGIMQVSWTFSRSQPIPR